MFNTPTITISWEVLNLISEIDEFKGAWRALGQLSPMHLSNLKKEATSSSTELGYDAVLNRVLESHVDIPLTESNIRQLHRELLLFSNKDSWYRGNYKKSANHIEAFETASPADTPLRMEELVNWTTNEIERKELHPLLIVPVFIGEFLRIHPFQNGNDRLSRILTTLMLLRAGYAYVPYSSLESVIEENKEAYYPALSNSPDWILFFLRVLQQQKSRLQTKIELEKQLFTQLPELSLQIIEQVKLRRRISISEIVTLTNANRNTIKKHLENLVAEKRLQQNGSGRGSWYSL